MHSYASTPYHSTPVFDPSATPDYSHESSAPFIGGFAQPPHSPGSATSADYYSSPNLQAQMSQLPRDRRASFASTNVGRPYGAAAPIAGGAAAGARMGMRKEDGPRDGMFEPGYTSPRRKRGRPVLWWSLCLLVLIAIVLCVVLPVYFKVVRPNQQASASSGSGSGSGGGGTTGGGTNSTPAAPFSGAVTGGDGSTITAEDGSTFTYSNAFGGTWYFDPNDPFNDGARAQSWSPALNETWQWGVDPIRGVNLGGWLVTEPFITPALFEPFQNGSFTNYPAVDEWTLTVSMNQVGNATAMLQQHYETFITEEDFARIAGAGLNWVRIPVPFWMIETYSNEPFVPHLAWTYFLKAIQWARKYGLRINMDLHTIPGSQNGWNHSGKLGPINFLFGVMGIANAQRALAYIRTLTEFVSQPEYSNVVQMFGVVNEAWLTTIGQPQLSSFYLEAHDLIRNITGIGNGPMITIHDGFLGMQAWAGFLAGSDRIGLDTHPYFAFNAPASVAPPQDFVQSPCQGWGPELNTSMQAFGFSMAGEWSVATNDCGLWVNGVGLGSRVEGSYPGSTAVGNCTSFNDWQNWDADTKAGLMNLALSTMDSLQNWFYWTWKIGNSSITGTVESPFWSYSLGLENGWIPPDPRAAVGYCAASAGVPMTDPFDGTLSSWQTGGAGAGTVVAAQRASFGVWPITSMNSATNSPYIPPSEVLLLPQYTPTGAIISLPGPTFTTPGSTQTADAGSGWADTADTVGYFEPITGCDYPDQWVAVGVPVPTAGCLPAARRRREVDLDARAAEPTPPPVRA